MPEIAAHRLTKDFGRTRAVDSVSFELQPGRVVGLLGPNGSGKTTTLRMLLGLVTPTSGRILIGDRPFAELPAPPR
jgi:ABC-2 type transport system ATP-binding protein